MSVETQRAHEELGLPNNVPKDATHEEYIAVAEHSYDRVVEIRAAGAISDGLGRLIDCYGREEAAALYLANIALESQ